MNRGTRIALVVVVVLALAYPGMAWLLGLIVEHQWQLSQQQLAERTPYLSLVKREYHGGVYTATEESTYRLSDPFTQNLSLLTRTSGWSDFEFTLRNTIHHGPLPQMRDFAPATVDSEIILPPKTREQIADLLGIQHPSVHVRIKWFGGSAIVLHSPAYEHRSSSGAKFTSQGIDARTDRGPDLKYWASSLTAPGFTLDSPDLSAQMGNVHFVSDQRLAFGEEVFAGKFNLTLGQLDLNRTCEDCSAQKVHLQNLSIDSKSSVQGEFLDMEANFGADALQVRTFSATHLVYEIRLDHIHGPSAAVFTKALRAAQADAPNSALQTQKVQDAVKTNGAEILLHDPVLEIRRIGFATPEGQFSLAIKMSAPGLTRADLDSVGNTMLPALAKHAQATANARIDTALLDKLLDNSGKGATFTAQLQALQRQGYLKLDGNALTTHVTYLGGQLRINDLPFPPMPQAPPVR